MALFGNALIQETMKSVRRHHQEVGQALGEAAKSSPLERELRLLIDIANGMYVRTDERVEEAEGALMLVQELLLGNALHTRAAYPEGFWRTDIGIVMSRVRWWVSAEDLITISNAAALAFGENTQANRMRIARAIDSGDLDWVPDPSVTNPQQNRRVLLSQVERLRDLRRLPE